MNRTLSRLVVAVVSALFLCVAPALAQTGTFSSANPPKAGTATTAAPATPRPLATGAGQVSLRVISFGVGGRARGGEWAGVLVEVDDSSDKLRNVLVRLSVPDADGDTAWMQRAIVTNPGASQRVWLYTRLPYDMAGLNLAISAYEAEEIAPAASAGESVRYRAGRLLGSLSYPAGQASLPGSVGVVAVVGGRPGGLDQYGWVRSSSQDYAITGHELTDLAAGLTADTLPDRWMGLSMFQSLVWTSAVSSDAPTQVRTERADAIKEYIRRGGHLVIVLPPVGQTWMAGTPHPLSDIMPQVSARRLDGVDLNAYRQLLTRDRTYALPTDAVVHVFGPEAGASWPLDTTPIMTGPDGSAVVVRRQVGLGAVTIVGIDVTAGRLGASPRAFMADQFWNRVLGKRLPVFTPSDLKAMQESTERRYLTTAQPVEVDNVIASGIAQSSNAATGVLLAFAVFLAYWLVAGPAGYFFLTRRGLRQHAWMLFLGSAAVFTAIAWTGASLLRVRTVEGQHLTVLDAVYGQSVQRGRSWMSLILPRYGEQTVSAAAPAREDGSVEFINAVAPWEPPPSGGGSSFASFPDARGYAVEARQPDSLRVPTRATAKQIQVDWAGTLPADFGLPRPLADSSLPVGEEIQLRFKTTPTGGERRWSIYGTLIHRLPAALRDVRVIVVLEPRSLAADPRFLPMNAVCAKIDAWEPNQELVLDKIFPAQLTSGYELGAMLDSLLPRSQGLIQAAAGGPKLTNIESLVTTSLFDVLEPPAPVSPSATRILAQRRSMHTLDLSRWVMQPCVMIIGRLDGPRGQVNLPVPLRVDDLSADDVRSRVKGDFVVLRWVYPLAGRPFQAQAVSAPDPLDTAVPGAKLPE